MKAICINIHKPQKRSILKRQRFFRSFRDLTKKCQKWYSYITTIPHRFQQLKLLAIIVSKHTKLENVILTCEPSLYSYWPTCWNYLGLNFIRWLLIIIYDTLKKKHLSSDLLTNQNIEFTFKYNKHWRIQEEQAGALAPLNFQ